MNMMWRLFFYVELLCCCLFSINLHAQIEQDVQRITLASPLTTNLYAKGKITEHTIAIQAQIVIPADAPTDLGVGAFVKDDDGHWFQLPHLGTLQTGHNHLHFSLDAQANWQGEPLPQQWDAYQQFLAYEFGLYFWSSQQSQVPIEVTEIRAIEQNLPTQQSYGLYHCNWDHYDATHQRIVLETGQRWEVRTQLHPMPKNPYDNDECSVELVVQHQASGQTYRFPGFYKQDMHFIDRGSTEVALPQKNPEFAARFRPKKSGLYSAHLEVRWSAHESAAIIRQIHMPPMHVTGDDWDPYVKVDTEDPRFFSYGASTKQFHWPIGINIRSVTDPRGTARTKSQPTPERMLHAYQSFIDRCAKAGVSNAEIWMSSWNLALEWKNEWPGFHGVGAYHEANAARLDLILDYAWERGIRVILVINNHGQASTGADAEWKDSPYNKRNGGPIRNAAEMFTDTNVKHKQQQLRRYIVGRYADHPGILCWKLWTEMNLTRGARSALITWHKQAFTAWHTLDAYYQHPCATHWSGDYNVPDRNLVKMKEMDIIAIDAYHQGRFLPRLLFDSTLHEHRGLARFNKPVVVTEFGGNWDACPIPQLKAEHASGFWVALMSGHASSPHLWWFEWVDQEDLWLPFRAMSNFIKGEDLRSKKARSVKLDVRRQDNNSVGGDIWSRAWAKPGYILGYIIDYNWGNHGRSHPLHQGLSVVISNNAKAGDMTLEWWDANLGTIIQSSVIKHKGGELRLQIPDFRRHLAFKLKRVKSELNKAGEL